MAACFIRETGLEGARGASTTFYLPLTLGTLACNDSSLHPFRPQLPTSETRQHTRSPTMGQPTARMTQAWLGTSKAVSSTRLTRHSLIRRLAPPARYRSSCGV